MDTNSLRGYHDYNRQISDMATIRKWNFANQIMDLMLDRGIGRITLSTRELQKMSGLTETTVKRYLKYFKELGVFQTKKKSWPIKENCWYVSRVIAAHDDYLHLRRQARMEKN